MEAIATAFESVESEDQAAAANTGVKERVRKPGGGRKGILTTAIQKVLLVLIYCKIYPTYDDLGSRFGMSKSAAFDNFKLYFPLVQQALGSLGVLPHRSFQNVEEFREHFTEIETIIIDVTERRQVRAMDSTQQKDTYSGKKKKHSRQKFFSKTFASKLLKIQ